VVLQEIHHVGSGLEYISCVSGIVVRVGMVVVSLHQLQVCKSVSM